MTWQGEATNIGIKPAKALLPSIMYINWCIMKCLMILQKLYAERKI